MALKEGREINQTRNKNSKEKMKVYSLEKFRKGTIIRNKIWKLKHSLNKEELGKTGNNTQKEKGTIRSKKNGTTKTK